MKVAVHLKVAVKPELPQLPEPQPGSLIRSYLRQNPKSHILSELKPLEKPSKQKVRLFQKKEEPVAPKLTIVKDEEKKDEVP